MGIWAILIIVTMYSLSLLDNDLLTNKGQGMDFYWNIITINSVFAGFMFSTLGIIFSVLEAPALKKLEKGIVIDEIYSTMINGIYSSIFSIMLSFILILLPASIISEDGFVSNLIALSTLITALFTFFCFIKSVKDIHFIIKVFRYNAQNSGMKKEQVEDALSRIKVK